MTIQTLGLVGASTMATGIAQTAAMGDLKAILFDASEEVLHTCGPLPTGPSCRRLMQWSRRPRKTRD